MNNRGKNNTINSTGNKEKEIQQKENLFNKTRINIEPINNSNEKEAQQRIKKFLKNKSTNKAFKMINMVSTHM